MLRNVSSSTTDIPDNRAGYTPILDRTVVSDDCETANIKRTLKLQHFNGLVPILKYVKIVLFQNYSGVDRSYKRYCLYAVNWKSEGPPRNKDQGPRTKDHQGLKTKEHQGLNYN